MQTTGGTELIATFSGPVSIIADPPGDISITADDFPVTDATTLGVGPNQIRFVFIGGPVPGPGTVFDHPIPATWIVPAINPFTVVLPFP